jgi:adenosylhomocysteine nucleosidase
MKRIGIIGAMDIETELLLDSFNVFSKTRHAGFTFHQCNYNDLEIIVTTCGIGKVNAAGCTQIMINLFSPSAIINTGVAGGMKSEIQVCDVVISEDVTYYDVRKEQMATCYPYKESFVANKELLEKAKDALQREEIRYHVGRIASGDSFIDNAAQKMKIQEVYNPLCVDMESCSIAHISYINDLPFIIFRSISDNADEGATISYEEFESKAAYNSAKVVLRMLDKMTSEENYCV